MKNRIFKYDSRLRPNEVELFTDLIGKSISGLHIENASINLPPAFSIENIGRCLINFNSTGIGLHAKLELISTYQETPPVVDSGGISVRKIQESRIPTKTRIQLGINPYFFPATSINYSDNSKITSFKFFGSKERRLLKDIDPNMDLEYLSSIGYSDFPTIEVDTIEFLVIEHESKNRTVISTQSGGFWYNILTDQNIDDSLKFDSYMKVNGYEKEIVLHHEVK